MLFIFIQTYSGDDKKQIMIIEIGTPYQDDTKYKQHFEYQ